MKKIAFGASLTVFYALIIAVIMYPFLFRGQVFYASDVLSQHYPFYDFYVEAFRNGDSILWNPYLFSGFPTYISQSTLLDPFNLLIFRVFDVFDGVHARLFVDYFLALVLSYLAARSFGISRLASMLVGIGYLLAIDWQLLSDPLVANSVFVIPFIFWTFRKSVAGFSVKRPLNDSSSLRNYRISSEPRTDDEGVSGEDTSRRTDESVAEILRLQQERESFSGLTQEPVKFRWFWPVFGGLGVGWALLAGQAQIVIYDLFLIGLFALLFFIWAEKEKGLRTFLTITAILVIMVALGALIALPHLIPTQKFIPLTVRAQGVTYQEATMKSVGPGDFVGLLFPEYVYFPYLSPGRKFLYVGALWFLLACAGFMVAWKDRLMRIIALLFSFTFIAALKWSPIFLVMFYLPVFKYFRAPFRWIQVAVFFLSILGGYGFDVLKDNLDSRKVRFVAVFWGIVIGSVSLTIFSLNIFGESVWQSVKDFGFAVFSDLIYGRFGYIKDPAHYRQALSNGVDAWRHFMSFRDLSFLIPFSALVSSYFLFAAVIWKKLSWQFFRISGFLLVVASFVSIFIVQWPVPVTQDFAKNAHKNFVDEFFPAEERMLYRTFPFFLDYGYKALPHLSQFRLSREDIVAAGELAFETGWPDINTHAGIRSVDGYDLLVPERYIRVLVELGSTHGAQTVRTKYVSPEEKLAVLLKNLDVLGMMAGKYIISGMPLENANLRLLKEIKVSRYRVPVYVYENLYAMPRFYLAEKTENASGDALDPILSENRKDFRTYTYLSCESCVLTKNSDMDALKTVSVRNGFFEFRAKLASPRWLVVSESFLPGWQAAIDGEPVEIVEANGLYMAILVPGGEHSVKLWFGGVMGEAKFLRKIKFMGGENL